MRRVVSMNQDVAALRNIGPTIARRLNEIGIHTREDLKRVGPVTAYRRIRENCPDQTIPVCYYLYSLEGALADTHWDALPQAIKDELFAEANRHG